MNSEKNNKIEQILNSVDQIERVEAPSFFYTRLKAKMEKGLPSESNVRSWVFRPAFAFAALLLVILINAAVFLKGTVSDKVAPATETEMFQSIASEYSINSNLTYEINQ